MALCKSQPLNPPALDLPRPSSSVSYFPAVRCSASSRPPKTLISASASASAPVAGAAAAVVDPSPIAANLTAFAPATVANLGPGFDVLGCAVGGLGDRVTARVNPAVAPGAVTISSISGTSRLSLDPRRNCAGIAAAAVMRALTVRSVGISLSLHKGLPLGSGLGSSAASAAAAAVAVNEIFGAPLARSDLVLAGLESEAKVSGYHADNIAPAILGGFVLIRPYEPLEILRLEFPAGKELVFVLVSPEFEAPTKKMRAVLPAEVGMKDLAANCSQVAALVKAIIEGDAGLLGSAMSSDVVVEPRRIGLIPGMQAVKATALAAGAFGCTISGAGPTAVAVTDDEEKGKVIGERMVEAFMAGGRLKAAATVTRLDRVGARLITG